MPEDEMSEMPEPQIVQKNLWLSLFALAALFPAILLLMVSARWAESASLYLILWVLAVSDWHTYRLPNVWNAILVISGLILHYLSDPASFSYYYIGAIAGFGSLALLSIAYYYVRGRHGLGMGDAKFMAGSGAWVGWPVLPQVFLLASCAALIFAMIQKLRGQSVTMQSRLPFGPFLCLSTWLVWVFMHQNLF
ncbi:prepilin peptidase [Kordiimonas pumila]|uniref:Prepilin peptidase n=1 Tax=Kordiimonas pumila TaxID=2161677 RepID=A0ABV7D6Y2_9PROT|nr:A24 family peptidase [Kordiimonas pumila]